MNNYADFIADLTSLISINTEKTPALPGAPFGEGIKVALDRFLSIANSMGFQTTNYDNYIGEVTFGQGQEIGIIGHLDVVPAGTGWNTPPYKLTKIGDTYYGRGLADDKAPLLLCLYALKELKDSGVTINKKFRLFVGCDEESGWQDVEYFSKNYSFPEYGFSPDGNFPVTYAEKGISIVKFYLPKLKNFHSLTGGTVVNAVCANASAISNAPISKQLLDKHRLTLDGNLIQSVGKSAHGSKPHLGVNAIKKLFEFFLDCGEDVKNAVDYIFNDKANLSKIENAQGNLTLSAGLLCETQDNVVITCDMRIPAPMTLNDAKKLLDEFNIPYTVTQKHPPVMLEKQGMLISALLSAYKTVTGQSDAQPQAMGGSTFGRAFKKGCSFGIAFPDHSNGVHSPNEKVTEQDLTTAYEIYKTALFNLVK